MKPLPCVIVLCRPEESRNIGSVCRAMKNMRCVQLRIVGEKKDFDETQVKTLAVHAPEIWEGAEFFPPSVEGLKQALADCSIAAGTTRRMGQKRKSWGMTPEQFASFAASHENGLAAAVFGNERTGLTDEELECCTLALNIPSSPDFPSLNLSHAVQVVSYSLFRAFETRGRGYQPISLERLNALSENLSGHLSHIGLYRHSGKEENERLLTGILSRAALSEGEAAHLEALFQRIAYIKTGSDQDR